MNTFTRTLAMLAAAIGFYGCDSANLEALKPGVSSAQEVKERFGQPAAEWPNDDGSVTWEYPRGPEGVKCWMMTISSTGVLQKVEQALTEENFARVEKGLTPLQVRRLLGRPARENLFALKPEIVWEWHIESSFPSNQAFFHVHFNVVDGKQAGVVTGTSRRDETPGR